MSRIRSLVGGFPSALAAIAVLAAMLAAVAVNHEPDPLIGRDLRDSTIWVATASQGLVHDLDATVGRAGPPLRAEGGAGADLSTVQAGSNGYLINNTVGSVRYIDAARRMFGQSWEFGEEGRVSFYADDQIGWAYIGAPTNVLQRVVPGLNLSQLGDPIPISADGDDAVLEPTGAIVLPDELKGTVSRILPSGEPVEAPDAVSEPGNDLSLVLVDDRPVVIDRTAGRVVMLEEDLSVAGDCSLGMTGVPSNMGGEGEDGRLALLSPDQGILVVLDLESCVRESPVLGVGNEFGTPLLVDGAAYVPNFTAGTVQIVEIGGSLSSDMRLVETEPLGVATERFDLLTENGRVVFNDPTSAAAGIIGRDGSVSEHAKFVTGSDGIPTAVSPLGLDQLAGSSGGGQTGPTENDPDPAGPDAQADPDPADPAPDPDSSPSSEPEGGDLRLDCRPDLDRVEIGQSVSFAVTTTGGEAGEVASYEFTVDGATQESATGTVTVAFDEDGTPDVFVRGVLSDGGVTRSARCQPVTVGNAPPPPIELGCAASVGVSGQVGQDITFVPQFPDGTVSWEWDFGGGDITSEREPVRQFAAAGTVDVVLRADVTGSVQNETTCPVTITASAPDLAPSFGRTPAQVVAGGVVEFFSTTPNSEAVASYAWTFEGANPAAGSTATVPDVTWVTPGSFEVALVVTNADGIEFTARQSITVGAAPVGGTPPPSVAINAIGNLFIGDTMSLGFQTLEGAPTLSTWEIWRTDDVGDRTLMATLTGSPNTFTIPDHSGGTYEVLLTVEDDEGRAATDVESLSVLQPINPSFTFAPAIDASTVAVDTAITFTGAASSPNIGTWSWDFGDGNTATGQVATYTFSSAGSTVVTLQVTTGAGTVPVARTITISPPMSSDVLVPNVVGSDAQDATTTLTALPLSVSTVDVCDGAVVLGNVAGQSLSPGAMVVPDTAITLSVSLGPDWVMPALSPGDSGASLGLPQLTITDTTQETGDPGMVGEVLSQTPTAGSTQCGPVNATRVIGIAPPTTDPPSLSCSPGSATYGATVTCTAANNPSGGTIDWGDGTSDPVGSNGSASHAYSIVGSVTPQLQHDGASYPANALSFSPDIAVNCTTSGTETYWQLVASGSGWDYAVDGDGNRISNGEVPNTTECRVSSNALNLPGARASFSYAPTGPAGSVGGGAEGPATVFTDPVPCCAYAWSGGQPGTLTMFVEVDGITVSETVSIYLSGCG